MFVFHYEFKGNGMHGLIFRSFETFVINVYGAELWTRAMDRLDPGFDSFEPLFHYEAALALQLKEVCAEALDKPVDMLLEDFGTYLVADAQSERVRRLLRFGGVDYEDFLRSLEDLPGRARLAVSDLDLPEIELIEEGEGRYDVFTSAQEGWFGHVLTGVLRALADDYGALVFIEHMGREVGREKISVQLLEAAFAQGRAFDLASGFGE